MNQCIALSDPRPGYESSNIDLAGMCAAFCSRGLFLGGPVSISFLTSKDPLPAPWLLPLASGNEPHQSHDVPASFQTKETIFVCFNSEATVSAGFCPLAQL